MRKRSVSMVMSAPSPDKPSSRVRCSFNARSARAPSAEGRISWAQNKINVQLSGAGKRQQFPKIQIVGENNKTVFMRPGHDVSVGGFGRAKVEQPGDTFVIVAAKELRPFRRHAGIQQELHAATGGQWQIVFARFPRGVSQAGVNVRRFEKRI